MPVLARARGAPRGDPRAPAVDGNPAVVRGRPGRAVDDAGAAVVDFVLMSVLLIFLLLAVLQAAVYFYARNVAASSAADAARFAAAAGVPVGAGAGRAKELIQDGLDDADAADISCTSVPARDPASGLLVTTVRCRGHIRVLFSALSLPLTIDVSSSVLRERVP